MLTKAVPVGRLLTEETRLLIAANDNIDPDEPLRLKDAIKFGFPHGGMTVSGLQNEARAGRLVIEKIANKNFTSLRAIEEMRKLCRVKAEGRVSGGERNVGNAVRSSRGGQDRHTAASPRAWQGRSERGCDSPGEFSTPTNLRLSLSTAAPHLTWGSVKLCTVYFI